MKERTFKNILVTGGCGFIGSNFLKSLTSSNFETIYNVDCLNYASNTEINSYMTSNIGDKYKFIKGNLQNAELVRSVLETGIDLVVHFAAQSHVDSSFGNSLDFVYDNVVATNVLLEECRKYGKLGLFIYISTDEVYGGDEEVKTEESIMCPTNPYSATKAAAEMMCSSYIYSFKMPIIITRSNNIYGEMQFKEKLIPKFIDLLQTGKKVTIHGHGWTVRSFVHATDLCKALDLIIKIGKIGGIYNIGSENEYSVLQIATILIKKIKGSQVLLGNWIEYIDDRFYNDSNYKIDYSKIKKLGWKNTIDFDTAISALIIDND